MTRWSRRQRIGLLLVAMLLAWNGFLVVVHRIAVSQLATFVDGTASIGNIHIRFAGIEIKEISAWTPDNHEQPFFSVDRVATRFSIIHGLRDGIWLDDILIDRPTANLRFDEHGCLIANLQFPQEPNPRPSIPFRSLRVKNAAISVTQPLRESIEISGFRVNALHSQGQIELRGIVANVLGATCKIHSRINADTLEGSSTLDISNITLSNRAIERLPLAPKLGSESIELSTSLHATLTHGGDLQDIRQYEGQIELPNLGIVLTDRSLRWSGKLIATMLDGVAESTITGEALSGVIQVETNVNLQQQPFVGTAALRLVGISTKGISDDVLPQGIQTVFDAAVAASGVWDRGQLRFAAKANARNTDTVLYGFAFAPLTTRVEVNGQVDLSQPSQSPAGNLTVKLESDGVSLDEMAAMNMSRTLGMRPSGEVAVAGELQIPFASIHDPTTFRLRGMLDATGASTPDFIVQQGQGTMEYTDGIGTVDFGDIRIVDRVENVTTHLGATIEVNEKITASCDFGNLSARTLTRLTRVDSLNAQGSLGGKFSCESPTAEAFKTECWHGSGLLSAENFYLNAEQIENCEVNVSLRDGHVAVQARDVKACEGTASLTGDVSLVASLPFQAELTVNDLSLGRCVETVTGSSQLPLSGIGSLTARCAGQISDASLRTDGTVAITSARIREARFEDTLISFSGSNKELALQSQAGRFLGGTLNATVKLPSAEASAIRVDGQVTHLGIAPFAQLVLPGEKMIGVLNSQFHLLAPISLDGIDGSVRLESEAISIRNVSAARFVANLQAKNDAARLSLSTEALGGKLSMEADASIAALRKASWGSLEQLSKAPVNFSAQTQGLRLEQLWPVIGQRQSLRPLKLRADATITRGPAELERGALASGEIVLHGIRWRNSLLSNRVGTTFEATSTELRFDRISGTVADGRVSGRGQVGLSSSHDGSFQLNVSRLNVRKGLAPLGVVADGACSVRVQGRLGRRPTGRMFVSIDNAKAGSILVNRIRAPIAWTVDPYAKSVDWRMTKAAIEAGGGRVLANADGRWNGKLNANVSAHARKIDLARILRGMGASGVLDGSVRLTARRADSTDDLVGRFQATLSDGQAMNLPVLNSISKLINSLPTSSNVEKTTVDGRIGKGLVYIDNLSLAAANAQVFVEGNATLQGRLNMEVTVRTGESGPGDKLLELTRSPLLLAAPLPVSFLAKANAAMKDRVVHLQVRGTAAHPAIRLQPSRQIGAEAIKFFTNQAFVLANRDQDDPLSLK